MKNSVHKLIISGKHTKNFSYKKGIHFTIKQFMKNLIHLIDFFIS